MGERERERKGERKRERVCVCACEQGKKYGGNDVASQTEKESETIMNWPSFIHNLLMLAASSTRA